MEAGSGWGCPEWRRIRGTTGRMPQMGLNFSQLLGRLAIEKVHQALSEFPDKSSYTCLPVEQFPDLLYSISKARFHGRNGAADAARHGIERKSP